MGRVGGGKEELKEESGEGARSGSNIDILFMYKVLIFLKKERDSPLETRGTAQPIHACWANLNLNAHYLYRNKSLKGVAVIPVLWREWRQYFNSLLAASPAPGSVRNSASNE